jgi:hypothetical protein
VSENDNEDGYRPKTIERRHVPARHYLAEAARRGGTGRHHLCEAGYGVKEKRFSLHTSVELLVCDRGGCAFVERFLRRTHSLPN